MTFQDPRYPYGGAPDTGFDWSKLYGAGTGLLTDYLGRKEIAGRLGNATGPVYNAAITAAGNMNPNDIAAQRFAQQQALVQPVQQKAVADLQRSLLARGMLGA